MGAVTFFEIFNFDFNVKIIQHSIDIIPNDVCEQRGHINFIHISRYTLNFEFNIFLLYRIPKLENEKRFGRQCIRF